MSISVSRNGKSLDKSLYTWDEETRTFSSSEDDITIEAEKIFTADAAYGVMVNIGNGSADNVRGCSTVHVRDYSTVSLWGDALVTCGEECVIIRRGIVFEVICPPEGKTIKFKSRVKGFTVVEESKTVMVVCEGKEIEISRDSAKAMNLI